MKSPFERPSEQVKEPVVLKPEAQETKQEIKEESNSSERSPHVIVSNTDAYIYERMKGQPKTIKDIDVEVLPSSKPNGHRLSLPEEVSKYEDRYTFRWVYKSKRAIDEACDVKGWVLVNKYYFPDVPLHLFTVNSSIERGDNILAFMPKAKAQALRDGNSVRAKQALDATFNKHKNNPNFYVPKDEETSEVVGI